MIEYLRTDQDGKQMIKTVWDKLNIEILKVHLDRYVQSVVGYEAQKKGRKPII